LNPIDRQNDHGNKVDSGTGTDDIPGAIFADFSPKRIRRMKVRQAAQLTVFEQLDRIILSTSRPNLPLVPTMLILEKQTFNNLILARR